MLYYLCVSVNPSPVLYSLSISTFKLPCAFKNLCFPLVKRNEATKLPYCISKIPIDLVRLDGGLYIVHAAFTLNIWADMLEKSGPEVIKLFSCSTQLRMKFSLLINMKMPTVVGIFKFFSREIFMLSYN